MRRIESLRRRIHQFHNWFDYGMAQCQQSFLMPDTRPVTFARGIITILGFVLIVTYLCIGKVTLAQYTFVVGLGSIGSIVIVILYRSSSRRNDSQLELTYISGFIDLTLIVFMGAIVGLDNPFVLALILSYLLLIPLVVSNIMLGISVLYVGILTLLLICFAPEVLSPVLEPVRLRGGVGWLEVLGFLSLFTFAIVTTAIFGHKYRRNYANIRQNNAELINYSQNATRLARFAQGVSSQMTFAALKIWLDENIGPSEIRRLPLRATEAKHGQILIEGDQGTCVVMGVEKGRLYADLMVTEFCPLVLSIVKEKLRMCCAFESLAEQENIVQSEKMKTIGMLASGMAHEVNNPLHFMLLRCEVIFKHIQKVTDDLGGHESLDKCMKSAQVIREGCLRIESIVSSIRHLGRPNSLNRERVSVADQLKSALILVEPQLREKNIAVARDFESTLSACISPWILNQIFLNILLNSIQAVRNSGKIRIRGRKNGGDICIEFVDNGCGMDAETRNRLFQPFFTTRLGEGGTGLGMSIVQKMTADFGGKVRVISKSNWGTKVSIILPKQYPGESGQGESGIGVAWGT